MDVSSLKGRTVSLACRHTLDKIMNGEIYAHIIWDNPHQGDARWTTAFNKKD